MRNLSIPTHYALTQNQVGSIQRYTDYAQAILTLIQNDNINNESYEPDEFFTSTTKIKTAISAAQHFLELAVESSKGGIYCSLEQSAFKPNTESKLKRIEEQRLAQAGGENE